MEDKLLEKFFEPERWQTALNKGSMKGINRAVLENESNRQYYVFFII